MGAARTSIAERETMLRRVALVLSSLPAPAASRILSQVDPQSRNLVHQAVATLSNVPISERKEALDSFISDVRFSNHSLPETSVVDTSGVQDEIVLGESRSLSGVSITPFVPQLGSALKSQDATSGKVAHFAFLRDATKDDLVELLSGERPQTIALVLASISPKQAADVLPRLDADLQSQTLNRIGRMESVADAAAIAVAGHLRSRYEALTVQHKTNGSEALKAIMSELPQFANAPAAEPETPSLKIAEGTGHAKDMLPKSTAADSASVEPAAESAGSQFAPTDFSRAEFSRHEAETSRSKKSRSETARAESPSDEATQKIHGYLVALSPKSLVASLGGVGTRDALLTLCGLPNETAEAAIALLPRAKAKAARKGMTQLGSLKLSDIDEAKLAVAKAAKRQAAKNISSSASRIAA